MLDRIFLIIYNYQIETKLSKLKMLIENFKKKMNEKYGMYGEFDFNSMIF